MSHRLCIPLAALLLGTTVSMRGSYSGINDLWRHKNAATLSMVTVFCGNSHYKEASLGKPRRRTKETLLAISPTYDVERVRKERRDRQIFNTMLQKMVPVALGLNLLGLFMLASYDGLGSIVNDLQIELDLRRSSPWSSQEVWHLSIAVAQYFNMTWSIWLQYCCEGKQDDIELMGPSLFLSLPSIEKVATRAALKRQLPLRE